MQEIAQVWINMCVTQDAMRPLSENGGIGHMWVDEQDRKLDNKAILFRMINDAERHVDMGYLTPSLLAVLDTRLYCAVRGGVNAAFGLTGPKQSSNQPAAVVAHDEFLRERVKYHFR